MLICFVSYLWTAGVQKGKLVIRKNGDFLCESVSFNSSFPSGTSVRVFASINHGNKLERVHDSAFIWVEHVTTSGFKACILRGGWGHKVNTTIDWFAFQGSQSGVDHGEAGFDLFTTGSKCSQVAFPQVLISYSLSLFHFFTFIASITYCDIYDALPISTSFVDTKKVTRESIEKQKNA